YYLTRANRGAVGDPGAAPSAMAFVEALSAVIVFRGDPVEAEITVAGCVRQAGIEQSRAHAVIAGSRVDEEVVHHQDAIREQCVVAAVERGKAQQTVVGLGHELRASIRMLVEAIEQRAQISSRPQTARGRRRSSP